MRNSGAGLSYGLDVGGRLGSYELEAVLGEGAMGIVFRAMRKGAQEPIALKVLKPELSRDETYRRRFEHEARAASEVTHPHLVPIVEAGDEDGYRYLASAYIKGRSLAGTIGTEGPLRLERVPRLVAEVAAGLDALHEKGLVHRDVKPSNIMIDEQGKALLTDFGLARGPGYTVLTQPGEVMGTLDYIAPELVTGQPASPATDIYALGCTAFECVAGQPPYADKSTFEVAGAHLDQEPPDPCAERAGCPPSFSWALRQAMAKDPGDRPTTATAYARMLEVAAEASA